MPRRTWNREPERRSSVWQVGKRQVRVHSLLSKLISNNSEAQLQLPDSPRLQRNPTVRASGYS